MSFCRNAIFESRSLMLSEFSSSAVYSPSSDPCSRMICYPGRCGRGEWDKDKTEIPSQVTTTELTHQQPAISIVAIYIPRARCREEIGTVVFVATFPSVRVASQTCRGNFAFFSKRSHPARMPFSAGTESLFTIARCTLSVRW